MPPERPLELRRDEQVEHLAAVGAQFGGEVVEVVTMTEPAVLDVFVDILDILLPTPSEGRQALPLAELEAFGVKLEAESGLVAIDLFPYPELVERRGEWRRRGDGLVIPRFARRPRLGLV